MDISSLSLPQICGIYLPIYEAFYKTVDPNERNCIDGPTAAAFLKTSGLPVVTLGQIWELADPESKGYLDKKRLIVALKLIALVQNGRKPSLNDLTLSVIPPKMKTDPLEKIDWTIKPSEKAEYEKLFNSLCGASDRIPGGQVKPLMTKSNLETDILSHIWKLSDIDEDGSLDKEEFILAMHLLAKAVKKTPLPNVLPPELIPSGKVKPVEEPWSAFSDMSILTSSIPEVSPKSTANKTAPVAWVVSAAEKAKFDKIFPTLDSDIDGYVTGADCKNIFLQTGLPQQVLVNIWNLCDLKQNGRLNSEQFALAMYFVNLYKMGNELPSTLLPEMIPPTLRPKPTAGSDNASSGANNGLNKGNDIISSGNKEIDSLNEELRELQTQKAKLEVEVNQQEASVRLKQSEIKNLQNELETLHQMIKQLENQKIEAKKRLEEMSNQVENLRKQVDEQKDRIEAQENELNAKRKELEELKSEELQLQKKLSESKSVVEQLSAHLANSQLQISQYKAKSVPLEEYEKQLQQASSELDAAIISKDIHKLNNLLSRPIVPISELTDFNDSKDDFESGFFKDKDNEFMSLGNEFMSDPFAGEDPFTEDDPFKNENIPTENFAAFPQDDGFGSTICTSAFDPFNNNAFNRKESDPFDNFSFSSANNRNSIPRSESPTPELPPKKSKNPPPRPAPPKHKAPPPRPAPPPALDPSDPSNVKKPMDPWESSSAPSDPFAPVPSNVQSSSTFDAFGSNFADFANFDQADIPTPVNPYATLESIVRNNGETKNHWN